MSTPANTNNEKVNKVSKYLRGVRSELKKVIWPNREELINHTGLVVATCAIVTFMLWVLDTAFGFGLSLFLR